MNRETPSTPPVETTMTEEERREEARRRLAVVKQLTSEMGANVQKLEDLLK